MTHYTLADHDMDWKNVHPGDTIEVMLEGKLYITDVVASPTNNVQRFRKNTVLDYMFNHNTNGQKIDHGNRNQMHTQMLNLNTLGFAFQQGLFDKRDYCELVMQGYSVSGFCDLSTFADWHIQNPAWGQTKPERIWAKEEEESWHETVGFFKQNVGKISS